ncbi:MAG: hypothetical protein HQK50_00670 [Oligoflexia bacterium]|nr:hypothetical protein [Oligoflexia bacterium]
MLVKAASLLLLISWLIIFHSSLSFAGGVFSCQKQDSNSLNPNAILKQFTQNKCNTYGSDGSSAITVYAFGEAHNDIPMFEKRGELFSKMVTKLIQQGQNIVVVHEMLDDGRALEYSSDEEKKRAFLNDVLYMNITTSDVDREKLRHISLKTWEPLDVQKKKNELRAEVINTLEESKCLLNDVQAVVKKQGYCYWSKYKLRFQHVAIQHDVNLRHMSSIVTSMGDCRNLAIADSIQKALNTSESKDNSTIYIYIAGEAHLNLKENPHMARFQAGVRGLQVVIPPKSREENRGIPKTGLWANYFKTDENLAHIGQLLH